jgi:hypothetical protein
MVALAGFIRCHPWRSPFGPAEAVQIFSIKICGKGDSNHKPAFTPRRDDLAALSTSRPKKLRFQNLKPREQNIPITLCLLIRLRLGALLL